ncbi:heavy-metal-associated domain-containing protein [Duganella sp. LX20W]|uniref:Heavy-metal-associated domain-containing protein n=1 Tax=Rugamonas brunnea TaxID=2758569 RepID=A0A7W2EWK5_9BURK|nr:heavy-metal-associated domain-containing protein [Rugamonas brunnea]MBA5639921.1 heavy-metal-associated domain-containing protein [Rugamonas brunnea]
METVALEIEGMTCGGCAASIEKMLYGVAGVQTAAVTLDGGRAEITFDPAQTSAAALTAVVTDAGYGAQVATSATAGQRPVAEPARAA